MNVISAFIDVNEFSRPGRTLREVKGVVLHNIGIPGQTALQCRNYFDSLKTQNATDNKPDRSASAHDIIDFNGDVYEVVPVTEKAYHVGSSVLDPASHKVYTDLARARLGDYAKYPERISPNSCLIGIELCHGEKGIFSENTLGSAMLRVAQYCKRFKLDPETQIFTHHDIVGWKKCPQYWVDHPALFEAFKKDVARIMMAI